LGRHRRGSPSAFRSPARPYAWDRSPSPSPRPTRNHHAVPSAHLDALSCWEANEGDERGLLDQPAHKLWRRAAAWLRSAQAPRALASTKVDEATEHVPSFGRVRLRPLKYKPRHTSSLAHTFGAASQIRPTMSSSGDEIGSPVPTRPFVGLAVDQLVGPTRASSIGAGSVCISGMS
jgi:hypothetical protein